MDNLFPVHQLGDDQLTVPEHKSKVNPYIALHSLSENTVRAYKADLSLFCHWLTDKELVLDQSGETIHLDDTEIIEILFRMPINGNVLSAYISQIAFNYRISTIRRKLSAIKWGLLQVEKQNLPYAKSIKETMQGLSTLYGKVGAEVVSIEDLAKEGIIVTPEQIENSAMGESGAKPILFDTIKEMIDYIDTRPNKTKAKRDKAILSVWFFGALRISEVSKLMVRDIAFSPNGMVLNILNSKTDKKGTGQRVAITPLNNKDYCPIALIKEWLNESGRGKGRLFIKVSRFSRLPKNSKPNPMSTSGLNRLLKGYLKAIGITDTDGYSGHSLRKGFVTDAYMRGVGRQTLIKQGRWVSGDMLSIYIKEADLFTQNATNAFK